MHRCRNYKQALVPAMAPQVAPTTSSSSGQPVKQGGRSAFTFDKPGKGKKGASNNKHSNGPSVAPPVRAGEELVWVLEWVWERSLVLHSRRQGQHDFCQKSSLSG